MSIKRARELVDFVDFESFELQGLHDNTRYGEDQIYAIIATYSPHDRDRDIAIERLHRAGINLLARLRASGHASECGINRCVECERWLGETLENETTAAPECADFIEYMPPRILHPFRPGECTPNCWQHKDFNPASIDAENS